MLRVRTLMMAVGVVALLLWGGRMGFRSYVYYRLASEYERQEYFWRKNWAEGRGKPTRDVGAVWGDQVADFYEPLARKYRRAMWRPWAPVAPDPPAPVFGNAK